MAARRDSDALPADVRAELRSIRLSLRLTQQQLADRLGCSRTQIKRVELGWRKPSARLESQWRLLVGDAVVVVRRQATIDCEGCGSATPFAPGKRWCSVRCAAETKFEPIVGRCRDCGVELWRRESLGDRKGAPGPRLCEECKRELRRAHSREGARRRRLTESGRATERAREYRRRGAPKGTPYTLREMADRDRWVCHLCGKKVSPKAKWPDQMCASVDHLIPISAGGVDGLENVALAHWICNTRRGVRGEAQLRLTG